MATIAGAGTISRSSGIVRFVQGGVVKTFRCTPRAIMPATFNLQCNSCSYCKPVGLLRVPFAICDDGSRVILPHPAEVATAQRVTGMGLAELRANDRLGIYQPCICVSCAQTFDNVLDDLPVCPDCESTDVVAFDTAKPRTPLTDCRDCDGGSLQLVHRGIA